jgi:ABC-2 type transport system permease protein
MSDALTMTGRGLRLTSRKPDALITAFLLPILIMGMFVYLFGGATVLGTGYVTYVVPGVMLLCAITGSATTAVTVCQDMTGGIIDRFRSMNVPGAAIVGGHVVASLVRNAASTMLVFVVAYAMGFRPHATVAGFLGAAGLLLLFVAAVSWLCAALGLLVTSPEAANSGMFLMFVAYASSALVPVRTMPSWLRGFAGHQPITPITESIRALLLGHPAGSDQWTTQWTTLWVALAWCCGILLASVAGSALLFRRRTA